jgi:signal transduction histidine kinase
LSVGAASYLSIGELRAALASEAHSRRVLTAIHALEAWLTRAEASLRGFLITGDRSQVATYSEATTVVAQTARELRTLTSRAPDQQRRLETLEPLLASKVAHMNESIRARQLEPGEPQGRRSSRGAAMMAEIRSELRRVEAAESNELARRAAEREASVAQTVRLIGYGSGFAILLVASASWQLQRAMATRSKAEQEVRRLNRELQAGVDQLTTVNQELETFSYTVSHDLRAPLRHINGFVDMLQRSAGPKLDEESRRHLDTIAGAAGRMGMLIDDLLAFSRVGRVEFQRQRVDLSRLVREVIAEQLEHQLGHPVEIVAAPLPDVSGDASMLRVVFANLVSNALKYSRTRAQARVEIGSQPGEDGQLVVYVRDNGVGFDMRYADKLFGVFQRLHRAEEFEGTGIGLATVRRIMHRHSGRCWAEGVPGAGATFYISWPTRPEGEA